MTSKGGKLSSSVISFLPLPPSEVELMLNVMDKSLKSISKIAVSPETVTTGPSAWLSPTQSKSHQWR